jgi:hypothetical protein
MNLILISILYTNGWRLVFKKNRAVILEARQSIIVSSYSRVYSIITVVSVA